MAGEVRVMIRARRNRDKVLRQEVFNALLQVRDLSVKISKKHMQRLIYDKPIPNYPNGKPQWKRTGQLMRRERSTIERQGGQPRVILVNTTRYAEYRHEMGKPGRRNTTRPAHWRDEARQEMRNMALNFLHGAMQRTLLNVGTTFPETAERGFGDDA